MSSKKTKKMSPQGKSPIAKNSTGNGRAQQNGSAAKEVKGTAKTVPLPINIVRPTDDLDDVTYRNGDRPTEVEPRTRRVSDVIDSIGEESCLSSSPRFKSFQEQQNAQVSPKSSLVTLPDWMMKNGEKTAPDPGVKKKVNDTVDAGAIKVKAADATDAKPMGQTPDVEDMDDDDEEHRDVCAAMPVEKDSLEYNMKHPRRGKAIILNHTVFEMAGYTTRDGSDIDAKNLAIVFDALHFEVMIHHNLEYADIKKLIMNLKTEDHSDADCLVIAVLSHGMRGGYVLAKDVPYPVDFLWHSFKADVCTTLAGKPKLFFIQACRGEKLDPGVNMMKTSYSQTQTDSASSNYKIPTYADFLVAYGTVDDHYAWRNPEEGTWFIQCLCQELKESGHNVDLLKLLTRASRRVALDHQSFNDQNPLVHDMKQVPSITTMLIRDVIFHPKSDVIAKMRVDEGQLKHA